MVERTCPNCRKKFNRKDAFDYHINPDRKRPCKRIIKKKNTKNNQQKSTTKTASSKSPNLVTKTAIFSKNLLHTPPEHEKNSIFVENYSDLEDDLEDIDYPIFGDDKINNIIKENKKHQCPFCSQNFSRSDNLQRHIKDRCQAKKLDDLKKEKIYKELIKDKIEKEVSEQVKDRDDQIELLKKEIDILKEKITQNSSSLTQNNSNNSNNSNNNTNNGQIIQGDQNNQNNQINNLSINLVAHGKEDLSKIDPEIIIQSLSKGFKSVPELVKNIHFNEKYPEFQNIYASSVKDSHAMVYDGSGWMLKDRNEVVDNMYYDKVFTLEERFDEFYDSLTNQCRIRFNRFVLEKDGPKGTEIEKKIKKSLRMMLYNYRHLPMKNRKNIIKHEGK